MRDARERTGGGHGGFLLCGLVIGSALANTGAGKLTIVGGDAKIEGKPADKGNFQIQTSGEVAFVFDAKGVTPVAAGRTVVFHPGSMLSVDAYAYQGPGRKTIALVTAPRVEDNGLQTRVIAAPRGMRAEITIDAKGKPPGVFVRLLPE